MRKVTLSLGTAISLMLPALAQAQTAEPQSGEEVAADSEILVTARRTEERLQDVPVSITAFSQAALNERTITTAYDLSRAVPGWSSP